MAINTGILDSDQVDQAETAMTAVFADEGLDCTPGTAVRELVIRPAAVMQAHLEAQKDAIIASLDLTRIASGEIPGDNAVVDALASTYRIARRAGTPSYGSILLRLSTNTTTYIGPSYHFYVGDYPLEFSPMCVGVTDVSGYTSTSEVRYVQIRAFDDGYYMSVPVTCPSGKSFTTGAEVQITGSVGNILGATVYSSISGGSDIETNQSLARRILYGIVPGVMSTPLQIQNGFGDAFGISPHRVVVFGTGSPAQRRDSDAHGGLVDVAVAQSGGCPLSEITFTATESAGTYTGVIDEADGVYEITALYAGSATIDDFTVVWGAADSTLHDTPDDTSGNTARYSSLQKATLTFEATGLAPTVSCEATVRRAANIKAMQDWLDSSERRAPGQDTLVRAPIPCFLSIMVSITGGDLTSEALRDLIVEHFNDLPLGRGYVSAQDITDALTGTGTSIIYPVTFSGRVVLPTANRVFSSTNGRLAFSSMPEERMEPVEIAFFTDIDSVRVTKR